MYEPYESCFFVEERKLRIHTHTYVYILGMFRGFFLLFLIEDKRKRTFILT